jgi:hypothetical protein
MANPVQRAVEGSLKVCYMTLLCAQILTRLTEGCGPGECGERGRLIGPSQAGPILLVCHASRAQLPRECLRGVVGVSLQIWPRETNARPWPRGWRGPPRS